MFAGAELNILQHINQSRGDVAYNVVDVDTSGHGVVDFKDVQEKITMLDGVLSSRVIYCSGNWVCQEFTRRLLCLDN